MTVTLYPYDEKDEVVTIKHVTGVETTNQGQAYRIDVEAGYWYWYPAADYSIKVDL